MVNISDKAFMEIRKGGVLGVSGHVPFFKVYFLPKNSKAGYQF